MNELQWYIGCSGFYYKEWKGIFYPEDMPANQWFTYYCQHFNTLELNTTFYHFPQLKTLKSWYEKAPASFVFSVKVPKSITHEKLFVDTAGELADFYSVLKNGLAEKLGPVLFQLPPRFSYTPERLQTILSQLDSSFTNVIEFRHISWWRKEVISVLKQHHITFCGVSFPGLPAEVVVTAPVVYYRFHGVPKLYYSAYDEPFMHQVITSIRAANDITKAFLYFNNTANAAALANAQYVQRISAV